MDTSRSPTGRALASMSMRTACAAIAAMSPSARWRDERQLWPMKQTNIGIAVVGSGRIGTLRARLAAKHPAVRFLAVSDRDPARAQALAHTAGADFSSGSNEEVIDRPDVTAVIRSEERRVGKEWRSRWWGEH